jgi:hypothetical protein
MPGTPDNLSAAQAKTQDLGAVITGAGATTSANGPDYANGAFRGIKVVVDLTVNGGGLGSITVTIEGKDAASGKYYTLLASAALTAVATTVLTVFPGAPATANVSANDQLPKTFRVKVTANNANPTSYTVGATLLP